MHLKRNNGTVAKTNKRGEEEVDKTKKWDEKKNHEENIKESIKRRIFRRRKGCRRRGGRRN
jgi:hypothetical protein